MVIAGKGTHPNETLPMSMKPEKRPTAMWNQVRVELPTGEDLYTHRSAS